MKNSLSPLVLVLASGFALPAAAAELLVGLTGFNGTLATDFTRVTPDDVDSYAATAENSELGGGIYLGYVWNVNQGFNISFEGYYDYVHVTTYATTGPGLPLKNEVKGLGGLRALPSFKITNNTEMYLELGWALVADTFKDPSVDESDAVNISGFRYGAGVQTMLYENISLRVYYSVIDQLAQQTLATIVDGELTAQPSMNEFGVGVAYHFQM